MNILINDFLIDLWIEDRQKCNIFSVQSQFLTDLNPKSVVNGWWMFIWMY